MPSQAETFLAGHQQLTHEWWDRVLPACQAHISPYVVAEIKRGDRDAAQRCLDCVAGLSMLPLDEALTNLAEVYFESLPIPDASRMDAYHLATASFHGMDYLLTRNCKHIAAGPVKREVGKLNQGRGIATPQICTPEELMAI